MQTPTGDRTEQETTSDHELIVEAIRVAGNAARLAALCQVGKNTPNVWKEHTKRGRYKLSAARRLWLEHLIVERTRPSRRRVPRLWTLGQRRAFGRRLATLRASHDWSPCEFADRLGIDPDLLRAYECGVLEPTAGLIARIGSVCEVEVCSLLGIKRPPLDPTLMLQVLDRRKERDEEFRRRVAEWIRQFPGYVAPDEPAR